MPVGRLFPVLKFMVRSPSVSLAGCFRGMLSTRSALLAICFWGVQPFSALADNGSDSTDPFPNDTRNFTAGGTVNVRINMNSFNTVFGTANNPTFTQRNIMHAVRSAIDNYVQMSGFNLNVVYSGTTGRTNPNDQEIILRAVASGPNGITLANAGLSFVSGSPENRDVINIFRDNNVGTAFSWRVLPEVGSTANSLQDVVLHEMGHSFGLAHNTNENGPAGEIATLRTGMFPTVSRHYRFAPMTEDIEDLIDMYGQRDVLELNVRRSTDNGVTWSDLSSNVGDSGVQTTLPISVNRDDQRMVMFYTQMDGRPGIMSGDAGATDWDSSSRSWFGSEASLYGTNGHGYDDEYMWAWVDANNHQVRVVRSRDGAANGSWVNVNPTRNSFESRSGGTPAIHKLANNTWILAYAKLVADGTQDQGRIVTRISTDDGSTWGAETELLGNENFRASRGVTITSEGPERIKIGFSDVRNGNNRSGAITTITAHLNSSNQLETDSFEFDRNIRTTTEPRFTASSNNYFLSYRGVGNELISRTTAFTSRWWSQNTTFDSDDRIVGPTVAARTSSNWAYMFSME